MKKTIVIVLSALMLAMCLLPASAQVYNPELNVPKATTAPTIDGAVGDDEYTFVIGYSDAYSIWNDGSKDEDRSDEITDYDVTYYFSWDDDALYFAATAKTPATGRTYDKTDISVAPFIFHYLGLMTGVLYTDPADTTFYSESNWTWSNSFNCGWTREWTISMTAGGTQLFSNHFGGVVGSAGEEYKVAQVDGYEVYEQKIPWTAINNASGNVDATVGSSIGFSANLVVEEYVSNNPGGSDTTAYETTGGLIACFGGDLGGGGNFQTYAKLVFAAAGDQVVYKGAYDDGTGDGGNEGHGSPETGDTFVLIALLGLTALAAGAVVVKKVRR